MKSLNELSAYLNDFVFLLDHGYVTAAIDQMDLNPVFVYEKDICVVDAKIILK